MKIYNVTVVIPKWLMFIISGSVASFAIGLLHRGFPSSTSTATKRKAAAGTTVAPPPPTPTAFGSPKKGGVKQRKGKK